jgi:hypothetical protein
MRSPWVEWSRFGESDYREMPRTLKKIPSIGHAERISHQISGQCAYYAETTFLFSLTLFHPLR